MKLPVAFTFALASAAGGVEASFNKTSTVFEHPSNDATEFRASIHVRAVDLGTPFPSPSDRGTPFPTPSTGITPFPTEGEVVEELGSKSAKLTPAPFVSSTKAPIGFPTTSLPTEASPVEPPTPAPSFIPSAESTPMPTPPPMTPFPTFHPMTPFPTFDDDSVSEVVSDESQFVD